jgi:hypothetical protein
LIVAKRAPSNDPQPTTKLRVADLLRRYRPKGRCRSQSAPRELQVLDWLCSCRCGGLGAMTYHCEHCHKEHLFYKSCGNRHCPTCGYRQRAAWQKYVMNWSLPCDYFHLVFTLPHELNDWMDVNRRVAYKLIFDSVIATLLRVGEKYFDCRFGIVATLHTWGQRMNRHVHVHVILTSGGLSLDGSRWVTVDVNDPAMDQRFLAARFKKTYLRRFKYYHSTHDTMWPTSHSDSNLPRSDQPPSVS